MNKYYLWSFIDYKNIVVIIRGKNQEQAFEWAKKMFPRGEKISPLPFSLIQFKRIPSHESGNKYLIWSIEHGMWWNPSRMGYTPNPENAGVYNEDETLEILENANIIKINEIAIKL